MCSPIYLYEHACTSQARSQKKQSYCTESSPNQSDFSAWLFWYTLPIIVYGVLVYHSAAAVVTTHYTKYKDSSGSRAVVANGTKPIRNKETNKKFRFINDRKKRVNKNFRQHTPMLMLMAILIRSKIKRAPCVKYTETMWMDRMDGNSMWQKITKLQRANFNQTNCSFVFGCFRKFWAQHELVVM